MKCKKAETVWLVLAPFYIAWQGQCTRYINYYTDSHMRAGSYSTSPAELSLYQPAAHWVAACPAFRDKPRGARAPHLIYGSSLDRFNREEGLRGAPLRCVAPLCAKSLLIRMTGRLPSRARPPQPHYQRYTHTSFRNTTYSTFSPIRIQAQQYPSCPAN